MDYRSIIKEAWQFTQANKKLMKWYAIAPSLLSTISGAIIVIYQYMAYTKSKQDGPSFFSEVLIFVKNFFTNNPDALWPLIFVTVLIAIIYLFLPTFTQGAMLQIIARKRNGQDVKLISGITYGLKHFLPLFEYNLLIKIFSLTSIITEILFVIRNLGAEVVGFFIPIFLIVTIIALFLTVFFSYVETYIVIDEENVFSSIKKSVSLVFNNWQQTFLVLMLLFVIGIRVVLNILLVILIPFLVFVAVGLFASVALHIAGYYLAVIIGLALLYLTGYLGGTILLFANTVWTFTFLELTSQSETSARDMGEGTEVNL